jgi:putative restriction endonuclease
MSAEPPQSSDDLLDQLAKLRLGNVSEPRRRAPYKPLLLLWLFGRLQATGSSEVSFADADGPLSELMTEFGPPAVHSDRAALPFFHLEPRLWELHRTPDGPQGRKRQELLDSQATGRLRP